MDWLTFTCQHCPQDPARYLTVDELANHNLAVHERVAPFEVCEARLQAEGHLIGRARIVPWELDETHWHVTRIAERAIEGNHQGKMV